jgi:hypothetical protein
MLLPSKINVVTKMPTEAAEKGTLNYWVPEMMQYDIYKCVNRTIVDYEQLMRDWLLACEAEASHYAGMRSAYALPNTVFIKNRSFMNSADVDRAYDLGYNCVREYHGQGPVIWGNNIAGHDYLPLHDVVLTVETLIKLDEALKETATYYNYSVDPCPFMATAHSILSRHFYQKEMERSVGLWRIDSSDWMSFGFDTFTDRLWMGVEVRTPNIWRFNNDLSVRMLSIQKLYPNVFTRKSLGLLEYGTRELILKGAL